MAKSEDLKRLLSETIKTFGKLDILVNNAGMGRYVNIKDDGILANFDQTMNVNLRSYIELIHMSVPYLDKTNGSIISISSIAALKPVLIYET